MFAKSLLSWWWRKPTPIRRRTRLLGEELESRCLLTTYLWFPQGTDRDWNTPGNWLESDNKGSWDPAQAIPGAGDDVNFFGSWINLSIFGNTTYNSNKICYVSQAVTVKSVTMNDGYTSFIKLQANLTISGTAPLSGLYMSSPGTISSLEPETGPITRRSVVIAGNADFQWNTGTLANVVVDVQRGKNTQATMAILGGLAAPSMVSSQIDVRGRLLWDTQNVVNSWQGGNEPVSGIHVLPGGVFDIRAANKTFGLKPEGSEQDPKLLKIKNEGFVKVNTDAAATVYAHYETSGTTEVKSGTLVLKGPAEQIGTDSRFALLNNATVQVDNNKGDTLGIREGSIVGDGTIQGNLALGHDPLWSEYDEQKHGSTNPIISPSYDWQPGTITVTGDFKMYSGEIRINVWGPNANQYNRVVVQGKATLSDEFTIGEKNVTKGGKVVGDLMTPRVAIPADTKINFLTYPEYQLFGTAKDKFVEVIPPLAPSKWDHGYTSTNYWFRPPEAINAKQARIGGKLWLDDGVVAGAFESGVEDPLEGITVTLRDATGENVLDITASDAGGEYAFEDLGPGLYQITFDRPEEMRFAAADMTTDDLDSDPDPTGLVLVVLGDGDIDDVWAGYYANTAPIAVDDEYLAHKNTPITGDVLANDSDADGDLLAVSLVTDVSHGSLTLNSDGTFTYTPDTDYTGTDSFTYAIDDASTTNRLSIVWAIDQPTIRREYKSTTRAKYNQPDRVGT